MRLTDQEVAGFAVKMYGGTGKEPFPADLVREIERAVVEKWAKEIEAQRETWSPFGGAPARAALGGLVAKMRASLEEKE